VFTWRHAARSEPHRQDPVAAGDDPLTFEGELLSVTRVGPRSLHADCVIHTEGEGLPVTIAVELSSNLGWATFEEAIVQGWLDEGKFVAARLTFRPGHSRLALTTRDSALVLPVRITTSAGA
jgi:hypothetical protein